jgi:hypothetical protein
MADCFVILPEKDPVMEGMLSPYPFFGWLANESLISDEACYSGWMSLGTWWRTICEMTC